MEGSGEGMLLVGFSKAQYNARVGRARITVIAGGALLALFVGGLLFFQKKGWGRRDLPGGL
jgi:hypothetical protein